MKKRLVILIMSLMIFIPETIYADSFDFMINPILTEDQDAAITDYYSIKATPNAEKNFQLLVVNNSSSEVTYQVRVNNASTSSDGRLDYSSKDSQLLDKAGLSIKDLLSVPKEIKVAGQSSGTIPITMKTPKEAFDGAVIGGISVVAVGDAKKSDKPGIALQNNLAMTVPFVVHMTEAKLKPELKLASFSVTEEQVAQSFTLAVDNVQKHVLPKVALSVNILEKETSKKVATLNEQTVDFAPQSQAKINLTGSEQLTKGNYLAEIKATSEYGNWQWSQDFSIKEVGDSQTSTKAAKDKEQGKWPYLLAAFTFMVGGLVTILYKLKRKQDQPGEADKTDRKSRD